MSQPLIQLVDVCKQFGALSVLDGLTLTIYKGQIATVIGQRGAGKSVLLSLVAGLMQPDSGRILYKGQPLETFAKKSGVAGLPVFSCIFRGATLFDSLTVSENIALPLREVEGLPTDDIKRRVGEKIAQLKLDKVGNKFPYQLSGEIRKVVILARALVTGPEVVFFDQPTTGMDPIRKNAVHSIIADCQKSLGFTAIITSYDIPDVFAVAHRVAMLESGKILFEGTPDEIQQADDPVVMKFIHAADDGDERAENTRRSPAYLPDRPYPGDFTLVILNVDNMEDIRAALGGAASEKALQALAEQIQSNVRGADRCLIRPPAGIQIQLPHTDMEQSRQVCAKLAEAMKTGKITAIQPGPGIFYSIKAGFAQAKGDSPLEQLAALAESMQTPFYQFDIEDRTREC